MARPRKPTTIEECIKRLQAQAVSAAAQASTTGKATSAVLNIGHHLYVLQMIKALSSADPVSGQVLGASQRFLAANSVKREPGFDDYQEDAGGDLGDGMYGLPPGTQLPFNDDGSPNEDYEDYNLIKDLGK